MREPTLSNLPPLTDCEPQVESRRRTDAAPQQPTAHVTSLSEHVQRVAQDASIDVGQVLRLQAAFLAHEKLDMAATVLATELASLFSAQRVSIGLRATDRCVVVATSDHVDLQVDAERLRSIANAMDEAVEQAVTVQYPSGDDTVPRITLAHAELANRMQAVVTTVPLAHAQRLIGAITFECAKTPSGLVRYGPARAGEQIALQLAPLLDLMRRLEQPWYARWRAQWRTSRARRSREGIIAVRAAWLIALVVVAGAFLMPVDYRVSAPARLEGAVQRALVAPVDGFLRDAHVKPGDAVNEGQVLAELADQDLELERGKWAAEVSQHENGYRTALARGERTQYVVYNAKAQEAQAQLQLVEHQLARSRIRAPFDGVIIKGDLTQSLGAPVKRGDILFTLAPADAYRLIVEVDERDIAHVRASSQGAVALAAFPQQSVSFEVVRITPVATNRDGRNFYEVEGRLSNAGLPLRPGLQGVAKIDAEDRPWAWIWGHRLLNWVRLSLWSLGG